MISIAWAQDGAGGTMESFGVLLPLVLVFVVFYFLLIRPQQKKVKEHQSKLTSIIKGDEILTGGGIYGKVTKADDKDLVVRIGEGVEITVLRASVMDKLEKGSIKSSSSSIKAPKKKTKNSDKNTKEKAPPKDPANEEKKENAPPKAPADEEKKA